MRFQRSLAVTMLALSVGACSGQPPNIESQRAASSPDDRAVSFRELAEGVWLHTSTQWVPEWGEVPSNGLLVETGNGTLLIDTAWNDRQTDEILHWARETLGRPIAVAVFTHAHADKMGGVGTLREHGVRTFAASDSNTLAVENGLTPAEHVLSFDSRGISTDLAPAVVFDPGAGHTVDNLVVALPETGILFGGCLIRPPDSTSLGNTGDADVGHWDDAVEAVATTFPEASIVVPSHGPPAGRELLDLTLRLAREHEPSTVP